MPSEAENILGYSFHDPKLLAEALTHASVAGHRLESNERMEFLGDAVLGWVISDYLYRLYPTLQEGELTKIKSAVVSRKVCARISQELNLSSLLSLGKGMSTRPNLPPSINAAVLESVIAAIYLDGGMDPAREFVLKYMSPIVQEVAESAHQHNFKSVLQQHAQKHLPSSPVYLVLDEKGPDHSKCFEVCAEINGRRFSSSWAATKKEAEQKAALLALCELGLAVVDDSGKVELQEARKAKSADKNER